MADEKIFEDNLKHLFKTVGPEKQIPDDKKNRILNQLISSAKETAPAVRTIPLWKLILKNPIAKLAVAAVIIITVGLFIIHLGPDEQKPTDKDIIIAKSPVEMTSLLSMSLAYKKNGLPGLEEHCEKAAETIPKETPKITLSGILKELNNNNLRR
jgi:hypothetical protein